MRILLDTHLWLWWLRDDKVLGKGARRTIESSDNQVFVSVISLWEAIIKSESGKLDVTGDLESATLEGDIGFLPFSARNALAVAKLPATTGIPSIAH